MYRWCVLCVPCGRIGRYGDAQTVPIGGTLLISSSRERRHTRLSVCDNWKRSECHTCWKEGAIHLLCHSASGNTFPCRFNPSPSLRFRISEYQLVAVTLFGSHVTFDQIFTGYFGDTDPAWVSGGVPLPPSLNWTPVNISGSNIWSAVIPESVPITSMRGLNTLQASLPPSLCCISIFVPSPLTPSQLFWNCTGWSATNATFPCHVPGL